LQKHYRQLQQAQALLEAARKSTVPVPAEVYKLFEKLLKVCELSDGAFDPSDQPLRQLWGFSPDALSYHVPTAAELASVRQLVNCKQIELKSVPPTLYLANPRIQISWSQFASGWLMDQALQSLEKFPAARLSTQGVTYYHGSPLDAPAWKVPVPNPRHPEETMTYLYLKNQALSVLGDYQDYFLHNGVRYSSLLDPRTGLPNSESIAVHVVSATAMDAELIARAVAILDDEGSKQLLKALQRSSVYKIVDRNGLLVPLSY
jgi:thiamine biosynthesis lipoprotein